MNYYISDMHLFHSKIIEYDKRPFANLVDMHNSIYHNWNKKIKNEDMVYILGDLSMSSDIEKSISYVESLKGKKFLIKGNHDTVKDYKYARLFEEICDYKEISDSVKGRTYRVVLFHYPIFSWRKMEHGSILLYGHTHNGDEDIFYQRSLLNSDKIRHHHNSNKPMAINVGCMQPWMNYEPQSLKELLEKGVC